jgi:hypothetical protein
MFTKLIIDGVLKIVQVVRYSNNHQSVARIYDPRGTMPEAILNELQERKGVYRDDVNNKDYRLTPTGLIAI